MLHHRLITWLAAVLCLIQLSIGYADVVTLPLHLHRGWNLFSLPITPVNAASDAVFGDAPVRPIWSYENGQYRIVDTLEAGKGYAIFVPRPTTLTFTAPADPAGSPSDAVLNAGWNLIGVCAPIALPAEAEGRVWQLDRQRRFVVASSLEPGRAYWLRLADASVVNRGSLENDQDGDGLPDYWEWMWQLDRTLNDAELDSDGDGLINRVEFVAGSNPYTQDSDGDGLSDRDEVLTHATLPFAGDSDNDGEQDGAEIAANTDPLRQDSDNDGMNDGWELDYGLDPLDDSDGGSDADGDGQSNLAEFTSGLNPLNSEPVVVITSPAVDDVFTESGIDINIQAIITDADDAITMVQIYGNQSLLFSTNDGNNYTATWAAVQDAPQHIIKIIATDARGAVTTTTRYVVIGMDVSVNVLPIGPTDRLLYPRSLAEDGAAGGVYYDEGFVARAFAFVDDDFIDVGTFGGLRAVGNAINNQHQLVGWAQAAGNVQRPFIWEDGVMTDLGGGNGSATDINDHGHIAGTAQLMSMVKLKLTLFCGKTAFFRVLGHLGENTARLWPSTTWALLWATQTMRMGKMRALCGAMAS